MTGAPDQSEEAGASSRSRVQPPRAPAGSALEQSLGGDLPCVVCRYNLRGLSIRSVCPECGAAVRATILALVDPHASEFEPIAHPRLTALGLVAWIFFALAAVALCWAPIPLGSRLELWRIAIVVCIIGSAFGVLALVRPHAGASRNGTVLAGAAMFLYAPLSWLVWSATSPAWASARGSYPQFFLLAHERSPTLERVMIGVLASSIALMVRPNARLLVARSLALRTGRVDRQTIFAIVAAAAVAALGECAVAIGRSSTGGVADVARLAGQILVPAGWALVTLGLVGSLVDAVRIAKSIVMPAPTLGEVIEGGARDRR